MINGFVFKLSAFWKHVGQQKQPQIPYTSPSKNETQFGQGLTNGFMLSCRDVLCPECYNREKCRTAHGFYSWRQHTWETKKENLHVINLPPSRFQPLFSLVLLNSKLGFVSLQHSITCNELDIWVCAVTTHSHCTLNDRQWSPPPLSFETTSCLAAERRSKTHILFS